MEACGWMPRGCGGCSLPAPLLCCPEGPQRPHPCRAIGAPSGVAQGQQLGLKFQNNLAGAVLGHREVREARGRNRACPGLAGARRTWVGF